MKCLHTDSCFQRNNLKSESKLVKTYFLLLLIILGRVCLNFQRKKTLRKETSVTFTISVLPLKNHIFLKKTRWPWHENSFYANNVIYSTAYVKILYINFYGLHDNKSINSALKYPYMISDTINGKSYK